MNEDSAQSDCEHMAETPHTMFLTLPTSMRVRERYGHTRAPREPNALENGAHGPEEQYSELRTLHADGARAALAAHLRQSARHPDEGLEQDGGVFERHGH